MSKYKLYSAELGPNFNNDCYAIAITCDKKTKKPNLNLSNGFIRF